jgi:hypothetical protein
MIGEKSRIGWPGGLTGLAAVTNRGGLMTRHIPQSYMFFLLHVVVVLPLLWYRADCRPLVISTSIPALLQLTSRKRSEAVGCTEDQDERLTDQSTKTLVFAKSGSQKAGVLLEQKLNKTKTKTKTEPAVRRRAKGRTHRKREAVAVSLSKHSCVPHFTRPMMGSAGASASSGIVSAAFALTALSMLLSKSSRVRSTASTQPMCTSR